MISVELFLIIILAAASGSMQAFTTRVFVKGSQVYTQGGILTVVAWIGIAVTFAMRSAILYLKHPEIRDALSKEHSHDA